MSHRAALRVQQRAVDVCATCQGEAVSFWAGVPRPGVTDEAAWSWWVEGVGRLADHAASRGVVLLAVEPEPGMWVELSRDAHRAHEMVPGALEWLPTDAEVAA